MYGTKPFSIVQRRLAGRVVWQVVDLVSGRVTTHASKREATSRAKEIDRGQGIGRTR
jgi:hypothetical protein